MLRRALQIGYSLRNLWGKRTLEALFGLQQEPIHVAPGPAFAGLDGPHDRVLGPTEVFGRMLVPGAVAAAHVTAVKAHAEVDPGVAGLEALLSTIRVRTDVADRIEVRTLLRHGILLSCDEIC